MPGAAAKPSHGEKMAVIRVEVKEISSCLFILRTDFIARIFFVHLIAPNLGKSLGYSKQGMAT